MTPKEKAEELVVDLIEDLGLNSFCAREVAERIADECIGAATSFLSQEVAYEKLKEYWCNVKIEIIKPYK